MEHLVIRLHDDAETAAWAVFDDAGRLVREAAKGPLSEAVGAAAGRRVVVLVPGVEVVTASAALPRAGLARLRKMVPYALEDALAEDVEKLFFAIGPRLPSGEVSVAIVSRERLEVWLDALAGCGLVPHAVYSEADGVPDTPGTLTLVVEDERVYGRAAGEPAFVFEGLPVDRAVGVAGVDDDEELHSVLVYVDAAAEQRHRDALEALAETHAGAQVKLMADGALHRLASTLVTGGGTNLLQGRYAPKSSLAALLRPWRAAAALLAAAVLLTVAGRAAEYWSLAEQDRALTAQVTEICREHFSAAQLDACEAAVRERLGAGGLLDDGSAGFLDALAAVAGSRRPDSRLEALSYRNGVMDLQLVVQDVPALDAFARDIERAEGFDVRIQSANAGDGRVEGRVQLVEAER